MLPEQEWRRWKAVAANGLANLDLNILTDWDSKFLGDMLTRLEQYKRATYISPKQYENLERIEEKLKDELGNDYED